MTRKEFIQQMMLHMASNSSFAEWEEGESEEESFTYLEYGEMLCNAEIIADYMEENNYGFDEEGN